MDRKLVLIISLFILLLGIFPATTAEILVGVKKGDWIEYQVTYTGTPPESHSITWARMEIVEVQVKNINLNITTKYSNNTLLNETITLNLETGQLGDDFIIPANLNSGDIFFDKNVGNITISGVEERTCAGARRTVVYAATAQTMFYWDKSTGVTVEANSSFADYTLIARMDKTNMWQPQIVVLDSTFFYYLVIVAGAVVAVIIIFFIMRRKK